MRTWTKRPMTLIKNADYQQIIETFIYNKNVLIINMHLNYKRSKRKLEITELAADINHMELCYYDTNFICVGDFNAGRMELTEIKLAFSSSDEPTWNRSARAAYNSKLDHAMSSIYVDGNRAGGVGVRPQGSEDEG